MGTKSPLTIEQRREILQREIARYVGNGYRVISQTDTTAQLVKPKRFRFVLAIMLALVSFGFLFFVYLIWYLAKPEKQVYVTVWDNGRLDRA